jgi:transposase
MDIFLSLTNLKLQKKMETNNENSGYKKRGRKAGSVIKDIKRRTLKRYSAEEKIRIVLEGLRGEDTIANISRKYGINDSVYYKWSKDFLEAGKKRLSGDTDREASSTEVHDLKKENENLKKALADLYLHNDLLKKSLTGLE